MAGLEQRKLTKAEWEGIEQPVSRDENKILRLIIDGFHNMDILHNDNLSIIQVLKVDKNDAMENHLYMKYFYERMKKISELCEVDEKYVPKMSAKTNIHSADKIRIGHVDKNIATMKEDIFEFTLIELVETMCKNIKKENDKWVFAYYTLKILTSNHIKNINSYVSRFIKQILKKYKDNVNFQKFIKNVHKYIELNQYIGKYADIALYEHQKELFQFCKSTPVPKLVLYIAPTGTGKTLSPLGLSEKHRIIFVCAARHVGLALAKSAISIEKKVAFAFGCTDPGDIRLHYSAAKDFTRHRKTGGIFRVDNSVGDNVEIMITDIASYLPAMYYMMAFNKPQDMLLYWDEPTITMDYQEHSFHEIIQKNWKENVIPNIVLSSATLPKEKEIQPTIRNFVDRFKGVVRTISSHDCKKSIPILNKNGYVEMPHYMFDDYDDLQRCIEHCSEYPTILRYFDIREAASFVNFVNTNKIAKGDDRSEPYFKTIDKISQSSLKKYYLKSLSMVSREDWPSIHKHFIDRRDCRIKSSIYITTKDSHTMTDGPTIYMADDIEKIAKFCIQKSKIPDSEMTSILNAIEFNNQLLDDIRSLEKDMEDALTKSGDYDKDKKMADMRVPPEVKAMAKEIDKKKKIIKMISLNEIYIPNKKEHCERWASDVDCKKAFTCEISDHIVEKIMLIDDIEDMWKILLLMGIGVFTTHKSIAYIEVMKELAQQQKLYMIIASTDYIYGTNYQFCHGFVGKDLETLTQEKAIQAMGRIGRNNIQQNFTVRFRNDDIIKKLFMKEDDKIEVKNMCRLFNE